MRLRLLATPWLLAAFVIVAGCGRGNSHAPALSGASAAPPPPTSAAAAAVPVSAIASPVPIPTPASTTLALALARNRVAQGTAGGVSPCGGLRGATLDACIELAARRSASPLAIDEDADREFRAAQARRDQQLMDREEADARLAADQAGAQGPGQEPTDDPRNDPNDYDPRNGDPRDAVDDRGYAPRYDDGVDEPPPDDAEPVDEPPPGQGYYPRR